MAPKTRTAKKSEALRPSADEGAAPQAGQTRLQQRLLAELHIDGTGLKGEPLESRTTRSSRGARHGGSRTIEQPEPERAAKKPAPRKRGRADDDAPQSERAAKKPRVLNPRTRGAADAERARQLETPAAQENASPDEAFLRDTLLQLQAARPAKNSIRRHNIDRMLPFLSAMATPAPERVWHHAVPEAQQEGEAADLYVLDTTEASRLLSSNSPIRIPVFVPNGAKQIFAPELDSRRPIEQVLDHFHNPTEIDETIDPAQRFGTGKDVRDVKLSELRKHFLARRDDNASTSTSTSSRGSSSRRRPPLPPHTYPYNFPDIPNPLAETGVPGFAQNANSNLLKSLARAILVIDQAAVCPERCPQADNAALRCGKHRVSVPELVQMMNGWMHWQSTLMLAQPGALTHSHWDKWGFGTWIGCYEGEMAFAWLSRPSSDEQHIRWMTDGDTVDGRWVFSVLRPGNALYMPPGTVHMVFRRPEGGQTMGLAGHVIRCPDVALWLRALLHEVADEIRNPDESIPYGQVVSCLVAGMKAIIERDDMSPREIERFGGIETLDDARALLEELEKQVDSL